MLTPSLQEVWDIINQEYIAGLHYRDLGTQVLWIRASDGSLRRRYIGGTNLLSQHVAGNAWDIGAMYPGHPTSTALVDEIVARLGELRDQGYPVGRILWRGVKNHYPHHAHVEGAPPLSQSQLWSYYEDTEEEMTVAELVEEIQGSLVEAGYDLGTYGPNGDGVDGDWGPKTRAALTKAFKPTVTNVGPVPPHAHPHTHKVLGTLTTGAAE